MPYRETNQPPHLPRKVIQLAVSGETAIALCDDGAMYQYFSADSPDHACGRIRTPDVPQD